jgi:hypothetical protein
MGHRFDDAIPTGMTRGDGDDYAAAVIPGGRPDGQVVFAGHGEYRFGSGETVVPEGTTLHMYSQHGDRLSQSDGLAIEGGGGPAPVRTYGPGDTVPDYTMKAPDGLTVRGDSVTVEDPTRLSSLLRPNQGETHWAACTNLR